MNNKKSFSLVQPLTWSFSIICLFASFWPRQVFADTTSINLPSVTEALQIGLSNNYGVRIQKNSEQQAHIQIKTAYGTLLPNLEAYGSLNWNQEKVTDSTNRNTQTQRQELGLKAQWTLFDGFGMFYSASAAKAGLEWAKLSTQEKIESATLDISRKYFQLIASRSLLRIAQMQDSLGQRRWKKIEAKKNLGTSTRREWLSARVSRNADRSVVLARELEAAAAQRDLVLALGLPAPTQVILSDSLPQLDTSGLSLVLYQSSAEKLNKALQLSQLRGKILNLNTSIQASQFWPKLVAYGTLGQSWVQSETKPTARAVPDREIQALGAGLQVSFPIFTGFKKVTAYQNSQLEEQNAKLNRTELEQKIAGLVEQQWLLLKKGLESQELEAEASEFAQAQMQVLEDLWQMGQATDLEFNEARFQYTQTLGRLILARIQILNAYMELERMSGSIELNRLTK